MVLQINDWIFDIDSKLTGEYSSHVSLEHCTCAYCENYYRTIQLTLPNLKEFLARFSLEIDGPVEMYPIEPTLYLSGYRVTGRILQAGISPMMVDGIPITAEIQDETHFLLEVGEMELPWILAVDPDEVCSPANEPEFLAQMYRKLAMRNGNGLFYS